MNLSNRREYDSLIVQILFSVNWYGPKLQTCTRKKVQVPICNQNGEMDGC
jgi:hypothetical protein